MCLHRADDAEPIDDLVGHERRVGVAGLAVLVVVVTLPILDVVGERLRHRRVVAVAGNDVSHVVANHAPEPADLLAPVRQPSLGAIGDVRGSRNADGDVVRVPTSRGRSVTNSLDRPLRNRQIGQLQNESVADFTRERKRLRPIRGHPHLQPTLRSPRQAKFTALVFHGAPIRHLADDMNALAQRRQIGRRTIRDTHRTVAATNAADRAVAEHFVERCVHAGRHGPVTGGRVGHHRPDRDVARLRQDLAVDHVRLLPQDVAVEGPYVLEPVRLRTLGKIYHATRRRCGL